MNATNHSSDPEQETVIETTTYIHLPGTHTTETEDVSIASETSSPAPTSDQNAQSQATSQQDANEQSSVIQQNQRNEPIMVAPTSATRSPLTITSISCPAIENKPGLVPFRPIHEIRATSYLPDHENARESACCKVHTVIMEQESNETMGTVLEPQDEPTPRRMQHAMHFCHEVFATLAVCMQMNKDCIFCLLFFAGFMVSASFLTAFFYRAMTINPQVFQYPVHTGRMYYV